MSGIFLCYVPQPSYRITSLKIGNDGRLVRLLRLHPLTSISRMPAFPPIRNERLVALAYEMLRFVRSATSGAIIDRTSAGSALLLERNSG